ncbi:MAG: DUF2147 domain-containing protein [Pseudomonadota bacterium]|nr:DUF2147 domain-containing protein [Pseudomonadota bacterium]
MTFGRLRTGTRTIFAVAVLAVSGAGLSARAETAPSPAGTWLTQDRSGVIAIAPCGNGLCGRIVGMAQWPTNGTVPHDVHGQPECGLTIISVAPPSSGRRWHGKITDPHNGSVYSAQLWVGRGGQLHLRGYIGLPLLGATQIWTPYRAPVPQDCRLT